MTIWTKDEDFILINNYQLKSSEISKLLSNRTKAAINIRASKLGLKKICNEYKHSDLSVLLEDSLEAYYWIGFILADGHITKSNRLQITLNKRDSEHLRKFNNFVSGINDIKLRKKTCGVAYQDKYHIPLLVEKFDINNKKTYNPPNITIDDNDLFLALFCGIIDGDGCIKKRKDLNLSALTIKCHSSWNNLLNSFIIKLNSIFGFDTPLGFIRDHGYYSVDICHFELLVKLKQFTLNKKLPILERKWNNINENHITRDMLSKHRKNLIQPLLLQNLSIKEISNITNLSYSTVYYISKRLESSSNLN